MASEMDNLVLVQLREIRAQIGSLDGKVSKLDTKISDLGREFDTFKYQLTHTFGLAGMANLHAQQADGKADTVANRQTRLELQVSDLDRRLRQVEEAR